MRLSVLLHLSNLFLASLVVARLDQSAENLVLTHNATVPADTPPNRYYARHETEDHDLGHYTSNGSPENVEIRVRDQQKRAPVKKTTRKGKTGAPKVKTAAPKGKTPGKGKRPPSRKKPSNGKTPPKGKKTSPGRKASSPYKSRPASSSTRQRPATGNLAISHALQSFDFVTTVQHAGKSPNSNMLSYLAMNRAEIPNDLEIIRGRFRISKTAMLKAKSAQAMQNVMTMIQSANLLNSQMDRAIAGEVDLTQIIQQAIGSTANMILEAVGKPKVHWHMTNLGSSPIPDIELSVAGLNGRTVKAVVEVKTPTSLKGAQVDMMLADAKLYKMRPMYHNSSSDTTFSLTNGKEDGNSRADRQAHVIILEQVSSQ